jgi:multiple sugar transport system ATP-binding protein
MDGRIVQMGTPEEVFSRPATVAVAGFLGNPPMNLVPARLREGTAEIEGAVLTLPSLKGYGTREVVLGVRPSGVRIGGEGLPATVMMTEALGEVSYADLAVGELLVRAKVSERPAERAQVRIQLDPEVLHVFDRQSGLRL